METQHVPKFADALGGDLLKHTAGISHRQSWTHSCLGRS